MIFTYLQCFSCIRYDLVRQQETNAYSCTSCSYFISAGYTASLCRGVTSQEKDDRYSVTNYWDPDEISIAWEELQQGKIEKRKWTRGIRRLCVIRATEHNAARLVSCVLTCWPWHAWDQQRPHLNGNAKPTCGVTQSGLTADAAAS